MYCFLDNCIWIGRGKFPLLWQEYLPSTLNMWTNIPKISYLTIGEILQLNLWQIV